MGGSMLWKQIKYYTWKFFQLILLVVFIIIMFAYALIPISIDFPEVLTTFQEWVGVHPIIKSIMLLIIILVPFLVTQVQRHISKNQMPRLYFSKNAKWEHQKGKRFGRSYIEIRNKPKLIASTDYISDASKVWAEISFKNIKGEEVYPSFYEVRWSGTPAPTALDFITQQPADYYEKNINANGQPMRLYLITKKLRSEDLYIHNAYSYKSKSKNIQFKKEQRLKNKDHIINIRITGKNTDTYLLILHLKPEEKEPPKIEIQKCYVLLGMNRDVRVDRYRNVEED
jgi:hypothetical protein